MSVKFGGNSIGKVLFGGNNIGKVYFGNTLVFSADVPCLTFSSPNSFSLNVNDSKKHWDGTLEYSTDGNTWATWGGTTTLNAALSGGSYKLFMRGINNKVITSTSSGSWVLTGTNIACTGNIESLLDHATVTSGQHPVMNSNCFTYMFSLCSGLKTAPSLPATTLVENCYRYMFQGCTGLTAAPALPATTLASSCYSYMFQGCTGLTAAPALPATTLASSCYTRMFSGCSNFKVSATQTGSYTKPWRIPKDGTIVSTATSWNSYMLTDTGGTFTSNPAINTTYYVENDPVE